MLANIIVIACIAIGVLLSVRKLIADRKKGIGSCGYNCGCCPSRGGTNCEIHKLEEYRRSQQGKTPDHG